MSAFTPTAWAETPTQANPSRISSLWVSTQSGASSAPPETLSHSTTTVPLNLAGLIGRYTTTRVLYGASEEGATDHCPLLAKSLADEYAVAVPEMKYSDPSYPTSDSG